MKLMFAQNLAHGCLWSKTHMERDEEAGDEEGFTVDPLQMRPGDPVHW